MGPSSRPARRSARSAPCIRRPWGRWSTMRKNAWDAGTVCRRVRSRCLSTNGTAACLKVRKCDMCYARQKAGEAYRMRGSLSHRGDHLLRRPRRAHCRRRSGWLAEKPDRVLSASIYGIQEVGGTSVLYLSAVPSSRSGCARTCPTSRVRRPRGGCWNWCPTWCRLAQCCWGGSSMSTTNYSEEVARRKKDGTPH